MSVPHLTCRRCATLNHLEAPLCKFCRQELSAALHVLVRDAVRRGAEIHEEYASDYYSEDGYAAQLEKTVRELCDTFEANQEAYP